MNRRSIAVVLLLLAGLPSIGEATTLSMKWARSQNQWVDPNVTVAVYVAAFQAFLDGVDDGIDNNPSVIDGIATGPVYCVDLFSPISMPTEYDVEILTTGMLKNGGRAAWLYNAYAGAVTNSVLAGALQLAIWESIYETGSTFNVLAGSFNVTRWSSSGVVAQANSWLSTLGNNTSSASYFLPTGSYGQAMIGRAVPEPATAIILGLGCLGALPLARRRRKQAEV